VLAYNVPALLEIDAVVGNGADLPAFAADPAHYQQVFENPSVIVYATHRTGCG